MYNLAQWWIMFVEGISVCVCVCVRVWVCRMYGWIIPYFIVWAPYVCVNAVHCICMPVTVSMSLPLTQLCWYALYALIYIQFDGMCVWQSVFRECALVQAVSVCVYRPIAAAGHHLWPSPPSGLLWLQIVPLGSQGLRLWMSEMAGHRQSPPRLDGLLCYISFINISFLVL